jgi:UDP-N-acetylmuramoyl-tripeptide--D-alanyl-D-alanine ligase
MTIEQFYKIFLQHPIISTDTRKIEKDSLFFALKGERFNANTFAEQAIEQGAAYVVIDEAAYKKSDKFILVDDVLMFLQNLARYHRQQLQIPVIAIVGSNGKTTTKELMHSVLAEKFVTLSTPGNFNNHIGLPLTLLMIKPEHEMAVIEMGANHVGENAFLCEIAEPNFGLITNNGKDHLEGFGSIEGVAKSNSELYYYLLKNSGLAFVNAHDEWLLRMASRLENKKTYAGNFEGKEKAADYLAFASQLQPNIEFNIQQSSSITSHLSGDYNFDNIMAAVAIGLYFEMTEAEIKRGIEKYQPKNNRSQIVKTSKNTIYMDAYNANPSSMEMAINNTAMMPNPSKVFILGDMFELGAYAEEEHKNIIHLCQQLKLENVMLVGSEFKKYNTSDYMCFETTQEAKDYLINAPLRDNFVFIKGSRGMKLEGLLEAL